MGSLRWMCTACILLCLREASLQTFDEELKRVAVANGVVGMSVISVCNGFITDSYQYGQADMERGINVKEETRFRIASISKLITAIGLLHLYERKFFSLDDDVSLKLGFNLTNPNFPEDKITFRMLLTHTSSLEDTD